MQQDIARRRRKKIFACGAHTKKIPTKSYGKKRGGGPGEKSGKKTLRNLWIAPKSLPNTYTHTKKHEKRVAKFHFFDEKRNSHYMIA